MREMLEDISRFTWTPAPEGVERAEIGLDPDLAATYGSIIVAVDTAGLARQIRQDLLTGARVSMPDHLYAVAKAIGFRGAADTADGDPGNQLVEVHPEFFPDVNGYAVLVISRGGNLTAARWRLESDG